MHNMEAGVLLYLLQLAQGCSGPPHWCSLSANTCLSKSDTNALAGRCTDRQEGLHYCTG